MRRFAVVVVLLAACSGPGDDDGAPGPAPRAAGPTGLAGRDVPELTADSAGPVDVLWDDARDRPRLVVGTFAAPGGDPEAAARAVLGRHAAVLGLPPGAGELAVRAIKHGRAGTYVRFGEQVGGLPVFGGEVVALVAGDAVRAVNLAQRGPLAPPDLSIDIGPDAALAALRAELGPGPERAAPVVERGLAVDAAQVAHLAYRITVMTATPRATWRALIDARTGAVAGLRDLRVNATGTGMVFDPNAVDATGDVTLVDANDADSATLTAARVSVTLDHLDGTGVLRGTYADARPLVVANRATSPTLDFDFTRNADGFEEVMTYFHLDRAQQRIQDLGITDADNRVQVALINSIPDDNSFYDPGSLEIEYGHGGVDDAEDGDIVLHEYGHSIQHDQVPGWGDGDESAMGEGFGDYLGGGFESTLAAAAGHPGLVDPACVGEWDATSYSGTNPPCLRRLDTPKHWPESASGESHDDGEVWSGGLWQARTELGADIADTLVIEHHFMLSTSETFDTAAAVLLATDDTVFAGAHTEPLRRALYARGVLRTPMPPADAPNAIDALDVAVASPVTGTQYPNNLDDSQTVTFPGATAVRVHFTTIDTEEDNGPSCLVGCDNIYLSDAAGDLYQILHGAATDTASVAIPGDTVVVRLVTDRSVRKTGYQIDRIESMSDQAAPPPDAAVGPTGPDAATGDPDDEDGGGCCQGSPRGSIPLALAVLGLTLRPRRRRRGPT